MTRLLMLPLALVLLAAPGPPLSPQHPTLPRLDRFARTVVERVPPLAIAVVVVHGDSVVHLATYGTREIGGAEPVRTSDAFYIASSTKSFTALTAALLASRGIVDLDAPIGRYAPEFRLPPPLDESRVTLRRLLSHRGGFESGPLSFRTAFTGSVAADSLLPILARTARPVDSAFTYTNTAFIIAARVLERVTGTAWQDLIAREVLRPLGLRHTAARSSAFAPSAVVQGFGPGPQGYRAVRTKPDEIMHAAGGMLMSADDAATWLRAQFNAGRVGGRQLLPAEVIRETHRPLAVQNAEFDGFQRVGYALGWQVGLYDGDTILHHFGNFPGSFAHISFLPQRDVGVAVFLNTELPAVAPVAGAIARRAYDLVLDRSGREDEHAAFLDSLPHRVARMYAMFREDARRRAQRPRVPPRGWSAYAGTYSAPDRGELSIIVHGDSAATLLYGTARSDLEVFSGDTLRLEMPPGRGGSTMPVTFGADGRVAELRLRGVRYARVLPPGSPDGRRRR